MAERRRPTWWIYLVLVPCTYFLLLSWVVSAIGPETVGFVWRRDGVVDVVQPGFAADRAGLREGDTIVSLNGRTGRAALREIAHGWVGQRYDVVVRRDGAERTISFTLGPKDRRYWTDPEGLVLLSGELVSALAIGLAWLVAWRRPDHATARLAALLLACVPVVGAMQVRGLAPGLAGFVARLPAPLAAPFLAAAAGAGAVWVVAMTIFTATFPRRPVRGGWLWAPLFLFGAVVAALGSTLTYNTVYRPDVLVRVLPWLRTGAVALTQALFVAWPVLLAWNYRGLESADDRRRTRVLVAGLAVSLVAIQLELHLAGQATPGSWQRRLMLAYWLSPFYLVGALLQSLGPLAMAYAVLRHRVFDVGVILRQGLQYAVARRLLLGLAPLFGLALVTDLALHSDQTMAEAFLARGWLYAALAAAAVLAHVKSRAWLPALDRAFFRERCDAQRILREVLADVRQTTDLGAAASRAVSQIDAALHPEFAAILVRRLGEPSLRVSVSAGELHPPLELRSDGKLMALVRVLGKPVDLSGADSGWLRRELPGEETEGLARARVEWLFPIALGADRLEGVLVLGPKRSEEPYTREDRDLLEAIASGLAVVAERTTAAAAARARSASGGGSYVTAETAVFAFGRRYVVRRELGRGGMGSVYEAYDGELERAVAIKVIRPDLLGSAEAAVRFRREARAAAGFAHPNVVTIHDFSVAEDGRAYLVMELLSGCSLREALRADGPFPFPRARAVLGGVCAAVEAAHERRLLHRDLKPENVFLVRAGDGETPKVLDFGVAKALDAGESMASQVDTGTGQLVGTLAYMSPEQLQGGAPEPAWDVWALTVIAYEMLAGVHPFSGTGRPVHAAVLAGGCTPPSRHLGDDGHRWDALFADALGPDPGRRPATAHDLLARFETAAAS